MKSLFVAFLFCLFSETFSAEKLLLVLGADNKPVVLPAKYQDAIGLGGFKSMKQFEKLKSINVERQIVLVDDAISMKSLLNSCHGILSSGQSHVITPDGYYQLPLFIGGKEDIFEQSIQISCSLNDGLLFLNDKSYSYVEGAKRLIGYINKGRVVKIRSDSTSANQFVKISSFFRRDDGATPVFFLANPL